LEIRLAAALQRSKHSASPFVYDPGLKMDGQGSKIEDRELADLRPLISDL
jgi:hypothetical protein